MVTGTAAGHWESSPARSAPDLRDPGGAVDRSPGAAVVPGSHGLHSDPSY